MAARLIALIRHAHAGDPSAWDANHDLRPLSRRGCEQADRLTAHLGLCPTVLISSPSLRCLATVVPLARAVGLPISTAGALYEGSAPAEALRTLSSAGEEIVAGCSHGDVIAGVLEELIAAGVHGAQPRAEKGSTWLFDLSDGVVRAARYLTPPP